jgi:hypothetical protein
MLDFADYSDGIDWDMLADVLRELNQQPILTLP